MIKRYLTTSILKDLKEKMVFIAGPRQVGKTTLAQYIGQKYFNSYTHLNWDFAPDRKDIINYQFKGDSSLIIFDEIHKYRHWKNYLKGVYDKYQSLYKILVTGSSRLDIYRKGGDSLRGRYFYYILHPLTLTEILGFKKNNYQHFKELEFQDSKKVREFFLTLKQFGPFPEPFLKQSTTFLRRWLLEETDRLLKEEIRDLRLIGDLSAIQILVEILPIKVGSLLSINNLREDLLVAHKTIVNYLQILEQFYFIFRLYPYAKKPLRSLKKMAKVYFWDWVLVEKEGPRLENIVASHLLKFTDYYTQIYGYKTELWYLKDVEGKEVDFLITVDKQPWFAVEVKTKEEFSSYLLYFGKRLSIPWLYQLVLPSGIDYRKETIRVMSVDKFLTGLV